jgi:hypothetical protein
MESQDRQNGKGKHPQGRHIEGRISLTGKTELGRGNVQKA